MKNQESPKNLTGNKTVPRMRTFTAKCNGVCSLHPQCGLNLGVNIMLCIDGKESFWCDTSILGHGIFTDKR